METRPESEKPAGAPQFPRPLDGVVVIEDASEIAGPYCGKLFVDAGATVIKVEPATGDPLRRYASTQPVPDDEDGPLFRYLNRGKSSVIAAPDDAKVETLLASADLLITDRPGTEDALTALADRHPHLVTVSITPFGRTGPRAGMPASDLTMQADSGAMKFKGDPRRAPVVAGGRISEFFGGLFAAPGALAFVLRARASGHGEILDVAIHEATAIGGSNYLQVMHDLMGQPPIDHPIRYLDTPGIEVAADGLVAFNTNAGHMFRMFLLMVERPDLMDDPTYSAITNRLMMGDEWQKIVDDWIGTRSVGEIIETATELRIPVAPVHDGASVIDDEQLVARGTFATDEGGLVHPLPPYRINGSRPGHRRRSPALGEHDDEITSMPVSRPKPVSGSSSARPLEGLKVLDLTSWWVGALATQTLGLLGADVVHLEGVAHPDGMRLTGMPFARTDDWWEWGHMFSAANAGKRGMTLDITDPAGRLVLDRLIERADVLVENFAPRVAESWGLSPEAVHAINPKIVYQRMPAFGLDGPWRDRPAFAQTIEPMSTMASITGFPDSLPMSKGGIPDPTAGMHGAWAALVALAEQRNHGAGVFSEAVMLEAAVNVCAQPMLEAAAFGRTMTRTGNRSAHAAPQGVYRAEGTDEWIAISVSDDDQWRCLTETIGATDLADDPRLAGAEGRREHADEIDDRIERWSAAVSAEDGANALRAAGIAAAKCWDPRLVASHPQFDARGLYREVDHPILGPHRVPGLPYLVAGTRPDIGNGAPTFGQHTTQILRNDLGMDEESIARLEAGGVIATHPTGL